jgi:N-methylhydantoinase B
MNAPMPSIADVERNEQVVPLFYLYRRLCPDTGGAGAFRGGRAAEVALTLGGIESADALIMTHGAEVPNTVGAFGGWPGATVRQSMGWGAVEQGRRTQGRWEEFGPKPGLMKMTNRDLFAVTWQGGGGWGDPLDRKPDAVRDDFAVGAISAFACERIYGVRIQDGVVDVEGTKRLRAEILEQRLGHAPSAAQGIEGDRMARIGPNLSVVRNAAGIHVVSMAGAVLSSGATCWRKGALARPVSPQDLGHRITLHEGLAMTAFYCPASGALLAVDVHEKDRPAVDDVELNLEALSGQ